MSSIAFYTGASGMKAFQDMMDVTAHNIANVNTNGYKARRSAFQDLLYSRINTNVEGNFLVGHGSKVEGVDVLMGQTGLDQTNFMLDFAIVGDGFFAVQMPGEAERMYTRSGAFDLSVEGGNAYLVTNDGAYVLDNAGNRIALQATADGGYSMDGLAERVGVFNFSNPLGLVSQSNARYLASDISGPAVLRTQAAAANDPYQVIQGALENSAVDLSKEMIDVITAQRAFQMNSRIVQTADAMAETVNNLRR